MRRPFSNIRPIGPLSDVVNFNSVVGERNVGSSPADEFSGMFESFTMVLEYNLKSSTPISDSDLREEGNRLEGVLNDYLFSTESGPLYFMRGEAESGQAYDARLEFAVDGDIWEGRLGREGKFEGSIGGTENTVNSNLRIDAAVANSYMFIYPTEKAKEIQQTGSIDMGQ